MLSHMQISDESPGRRQPSISSRASAELKPCLNFGISIAPTFFTEVSEKDSKETSRGAKLGFIGGWPSPSTFRTSIYSKVRKSQNRLISGLLASELCPCLPPSNGFLKFVLRTSVYFMLQSGAHRTRIFATTFLRWFLSPFSSPDLTIPGKVTQRISL